MSSSRRSSNKTVDSLSRTEWVIAGTRALVLGGVKDVRVEQIARDLKVTKGSFYWHFRSRIDFLEAIVCHWTEQNVAPFELAYNTKADNPIQRYRNFCEIWLNDAQFDPLLDSAMRDWGRHDQSVSKRVREADAIRIRILKLIFIDFGYDENESEVRARITYYHQVGYYLLDLQEPDEERRRLFPHYFRVLAGVPLPPNSKRNGD